MEIIYIGVGIFLGWLVRTLHYTHPERVRQSGIDCPEKGQALRQRKGCGLILICCRRGSGGG
jgi:hypothetical protein